MDPSSPADPPPGSPGPEVLARVHDDLREEYYRVSAIVDGFDQRLLTIKGWGVTLSLASIGLGFQQDHYGLFLVAALSGLGFWIIEAVTKMHQMRFYPRMGDIEYAAYQLFRLDTPEGPVSAPLIDWGWYTARQRVRKSKWKGDPRVPKRWDDELEAARSLHHRPALFAHVFMPHLISVIAGGILFVIGLAGALGPI